MYLSFLKFDWVNIPQVLLGILAVYVCILHVTFVMLDTSYWGGKKNLKCVSSKNLFSCGLCFCLDKGNLGNHVWLCMHLCSRCCYSSSREVQWQRRRKGKGRPRPGWQCGDTESKTWPSGCRSPHLTVEMYQYFFRFTWFLMKHCNLLRTYREKKTPWDATL